MHFSSVNYVQRICSHGHNYFSFFTVCVTKYNPLLPVTSIDYNRFHYWKSNWSHNSFNKLPAAQVFCEVFCLLFCLPFLFLWSILFVFWQKEDSGGKTRKRYPLPMDNLPLNEQRWKLFLCWNLHILSYLHIKFHWNPLNDVRGDVLTRYVARVQLFKG